MRGEDDKICQIGEDELELVNKGTKCRDLIRSNWCYETEVVVSRCVPKLVSDSFEIKF